MRTDIREFFASVRPADVERALRERRADPAGIRALRGLLETLVDAGVPGLPAGPDASLPLAHAVLERADRAVADTVGESSRTGFVRWVDDYVVVASCERQAERALVRLSETLGRMELRTAPEKTSFSVVGGNGVASGLGSGSWSRGPGTPTIRPA
jgi:hypothetical protein